MMTYSQTVNYLYSDYLAFHRIGKKAYKANLNNTLLLDDYFKQPHKYYKTIHIAGTNGKGSVSHLIASALQEAGFKTGLYTSPHLLDFRERIKINGVEINENEVCCFIDKHKAIFEKIKPSFFEITTAMAFDYFKQQQVDIAVIETGLGGRLDSTNIITPVVSVITNIGFDHTEFLGNTLESIATEKAGIIKLNIPVVIGERQNDIEHIFKQKANQFNTKILFATDSYYVKNIKQKNNFLVFDIYKFDELYIKELLLDLPGLYQKKNCITALQTIEVLENYEIKINKEQIISAFKNTIKNTNFRGRWEIIKNTPLTICDTAHNAHGITNVMEQLRTFNNKKIHIIFGMVNDKNIDEIFPLLLTDAVYYFTKPNIPRAMNENLLVNKSKQYNLQCSAYETVSNAIVAAQKNSSVNDLIFICGSNFIVSEALKFYNCSTIDLP